MKKNKNLYHILLATTIVIGISVGSGIFFQNENIISWAKGDAWIVVTAWIIGSIIALSITLSYVEIVRSAKRSNTGVGEFAEQLINKKIGWHTKMNWANYYYAFFSFAVSCFVAKFVVNLFTKSGVINPNSDHTWMIILIGIGLMLFFLTINILLPKLGEILQINLTILKSIPLIIISIGGIVTFFYLNNYNNWWVNDPPNHLSPVISSATNHLGSAGIILFILPAILFSFDGSINVTNITEDVKKRKHITFALIFGMTIITIIYLLVTVAILNTGTLNAQDAIITMFGGNIKDLSSAFIIISSFMQFFIIIAAVGVLNGVTLTWVRSMKAIIKRPTTFRIFSNCFGLSMLNFGIPLIILTLLLDYTNISSVSHLDVSIINLIAMNTTIITYSIYSLIILFGMYRYINNKKKNLNDNKYNYKRWFPYVAIVGIIGVLIVVCYQFLYVFLYKNLTNPDSVINGMYSWVYMILCLGYISWYLALPFVLKKVLKNNYKEVF